MSQSPALSKRQIGRPTKFNEETIERFCTAIGAGLSVKSGCVVAGVGVTTLNEWRERYPDLEERIAEAREQARLKALQAIKDAGAHDWRAWRDWLKLAFPAEYCGNGSKIEVNATAKITVPLITEEDQLDLQERLRKLREI